MRLLEPSFEIYPGSFGIQDFLEIAFVFHVIHRCWFLRSVRSEQIRIKQITKIIHLELRHRTCGTDGAVRVSEMYSSTSIVLY